MLYDNGTSEQRKSRELDLLRSTLSGIDESYSWEQGKELLQEIVFPWCEKFGTWSSNRERVDRVPNRKVPQQTGEYSVLGPQKGSVSRLSPKQESTSTKTPNSFQCLVLKETEERVDRALNRKAPKGTAGEATSSPPFSSISIESSTDSVATPLISAVFPASVSVVFNPEPTEHCDQLL